MSNIRCYLKRVHEFGGTLKTMWWFGRSWHKVMVGEPVVGLHII